MTVYKCIRNRKFPSMSKDSIHSYLHMSVFSPLLVEPNVREQRENREEVREREREREAAQA